MPSRYGLEIRAASPADAAGLGELLTLAGVVIDVRSLAERLDLAQAEPGVVLLASEWGPPSGVIAVHWMWTLAEPQRIAVISTLLVDPPARRRGVARLLLKAASQAARTAGCGVLHALTQDDDASLSAFYAATGFTHEGAAHTRSLRKRS